MSQGDWLRTASAVLMIWLVAGSLAALALSALKTRRRGKRK